MQYFILILTFSSTAFCAIVGEIPFDTTDSDIVENGTRSEEPFTDAFNTDAEEVTVDIVSEQRNTIEINTEWPSETSPLFKVIRNFLFQARDGFFEPLGTITEGPIDEKTEHIIKFIEHGLIEATTGLINQVENVALTTVPSTAVENETFSAEKRKGDSIPEISQEGINVNVPVSKNKRQTAFDMISNMSTSCSNCYDNLQSCVQRCFVLHNCNDIQRNVRACPHSPGRLCNPFTPWNPVDECQSSEDCKSPLLCCNDGCINKCVSGVWRS